MATTDRIGSGGFPGASGISGAPSLGGDGVEAFSVPDEIKRSLEILVVDDEHTFRESCSLILKGEDYKVETCGRGDEALERLKQKSFDIVLLDLYMSKVSGMELLAAALEANPETIVIVMTGNPSVQTSVDALRLGAWDYIPKPFSATHLQILVGRAAYAVAVSRESRRVKVAREQGAGHSEKVTLLGVSPVFQETIELARKVAATDASVFLTGESGTGKEVIAQFIHHHSRRSSRELVPVNCAALPEALLESEMFGHVHGAFTGAIREKKGLLEVANGGTLFLDELTEMPLSIQAKLLRVIQDGVLRRVGSTTTDAVVTVRFIAATNQNPEEAVELGTLRRDLYYRLRVVPIHIPPLRERPEDIPILAAHFLHEFWEQHRPQHRSRFPSLSDEAMSALVAAPWVGNVRELRNVIEHTVVLLDPEQDVLREHIPFIEGADGPPQRAGGALGAGFVVDAEQDYHPAREQVLAAFEQEYLRQVVRRAEGNMSDAARLAGVDRTTLYRLMQKHGMDRGDLLHDDA